MDHSLSQAEQKFHEIFPASRLKPQQSEVIHALAQGKNVFASLPTGYGKSLCYWLPAAAWAWRVWVVCPLISLMEDQVAACERAGVKALALHAGSPASDRARLRAGDWQVLLISPERLAAWAAGGMISELELSGLRPHLIALDEMHCFEDWRKFRTGYSSAFAPLRNWVDSGSLLLGLSASFSRAESEAWMREFCESHQRIEAPLTRNNLSLCVLPLEEDHWRWLFLTAFLRDLHAPESALVYCSSRQEADEVGQWLCSAGYDAVSYHAGIPAVVRRERSRAFRAGRTRIVCATSAFGMGIDYPHVGRVLHFSLPYDLESYWQEVGRAGRSGAEAAALALWKKSDIQRLRGMEAEAKEKFGLLWNAWLGGSCRMRAVAQRLGMDEPECGKCDRCREKLGIRFTGPLDGLEAFLRELPWWVQPEAEPRAWLERKLGTESPA